MNFSSDMDAIFAAVGRATTAWETLEAHLSYLYSIFVGKPLDFSALKEYGRKNKIFELRMQALCEAGAKYFQTAPSQPKESELHSLISGARRLAVFRHQIAHGVVDGYERAEGGIVYKLVPPSHGVFHLTKATGQEKYSYGSAEIDKFKAEFDAHSERAKAFNHSLHPLP